MEIKSLTMLLEELPVLANQISLFWDAFFHSNITVNKPITGEKYFIISNVTNEAPTDVI